MDIKLFFSEDDGADRLVKELKEKGYRVDTHYFDFGASLGTGSTGTIRAKVDFKDGVPMTMVHVFDILEEAIVSVYCGNDWRKNVEDWLSY